MKIDVGASGLTFSSMLALMKMSYSALSRATASKGFGSSGVTMPESIQNRPRVS